MASLTPTFRWTGTCLHAIFQLRPAPTITSPSDSMIPSSHNRLNPRAAASEAHLTRECRPLGLGGRFETDDVERDESATRVSQSSFEFHTDRSFRLEPLRGLLFDFLAGGARYNPPLRFVELGAGLGGMLEWSRARGSRKKRWPRVGRGMRSNCVGNDNAVWLFVITRVRIG